MPVPLLTHPELPIVGRAEKFPVRRIYCVGRNYLEHIREMKEADERDPPFFFQKPSDALVSNGKVPYPAFTDDFQYEFELVIAIGRAASKLNTEQALDCVYGYGVGLDMTRRDRQRDAFKSGLPWEIGKSFDHSSPCGPIHPVSLCGHKLTGALELSVNGQVRQRSVLEKMIWNVPEIIAQLSRQYRLMPGDLIYTGTPDGVGAVVAGDRLVGTVAGLEPLVVDILPPLLPHASASLD
ncbi:fumarylacetoacetate hydrolase family protein [Lacisediminimonas profundi]|uniref:fumarylacetoacetate hydrolase family protein n=1 Tax=Lacisediminimonas profundi TaxID=2603856 RepID=UPI00124B0C2A|nr:fumarylacetoacetate hydrolase family protein [Lacisediminimonas profundi]